MTTCPLILLLLICGLAASISVIVPIAFTFLLTLFRENSLEQGNIKATQLCHCSLCTGLDCCYSEVRNPMFPAYTALIAGSTKVEYLLKLSATRIKRYHRNIRGNKSINNGKN